MSWMETGKVISTTSNLVVRLKFGKLATFKNKGNYEKGDSISIICTKSGKISILECEHTATASILPEPPEPEDVDYSKLEYLEDLG